MLEVFRVVFGGKTFGRLFLATIWSAFAMWFVAHIITCTIAPDSLRFVDTILGFIMGTIIAGILGYYFGSSQSASDNEGILAKTVPTSSSTVSTTVSSTEKNKEP